MVATAALAAIDPAAGTIIAAVVAGAFGLALRWTPKTRSEAGLERANTRLTEAQALANAMDAQARELTRAHARVDELENALEEERRECDRRIDELGSQLQELRSRVNQS